MIASIPNILTFSRILILPAFVGAFYLPGDTANWTTLGLFILAGITDFFDGYLARVWNVQSRLGRFFDPIADKLLVAVALMMLVSFDVIGDWSIFAAIVILCREILVSGLREFLAEIKVSVPVSTLAKWKTTVQIVALAFLLLGDAGRPLPITGIGIVGLWVAAVLTLYTGYDYLRAGIRHMTTGEAPPS